LQYRFQFKNQEGNMACAMEGFAFANARASGTAIENNGTKREMHPGAEIRPWRTFGGIVGRSKLALAGASEIRQWQRSVTNSSAAIRRFPAAGFEIFRR
jgi:hypothetical protein